MRFYGLGFFEVNAMPMNSFLELWYAITPIEANETLLNTRVNSYSDMKESGRKRFDSIMKRLSKKYLDTGNDKPATMQSLAENLARMLGRGR